MKERAGVPFDTKFFKKKYENGIKQSINDIFTYIYNSNHWKGNVSVSGEGSDDIQTKEIKKQLTGIIKEFNIKTLLDLPCGDFNWMNTINFDLEKYIGADIVQDIILKNTASYGNDFREFKVLNIISDPLPPADLLFCRDCLVHLSNEDIIRSLNNIKSSNIKYLLTTTFPECDINEDIVTGDWRIINLQKAPFNLPEPIKIINENCTEGNSTYNDKSMGLWYIKEI